MPRNSIRPNQIARFDGSAVAAADFQLAIASSTSITVSAGKLLDANGGTWTFAGGTCPLQHLTNGDFAGRYLGIDPVTGKLHCFRYRLHATMIWLAKVSRTGGVVTIDAIYAPAWPHSNLQRWKAKARKWSTTASSGAPLRVAIIGTSLSNLAIASGTTQPTSAYWTSLLFSSDSNTYPTLGHLRIPHIQNGTPSGSVALMNDLPARNAYSSTNNSRVIVDNYSMGSNNVHWHTCMVAPALEVVDSGVSGTAWAVRPGSMGKRAQANLKRAMPSPLLADPYDLVIFDSTPNGGIHKMAHYDNIVRKLQEAGSEVILTRAFQSTNANGDGDALEQFIPDIAAVAKARGCDIADWASFLWEQIDLIGPRADALNGNAQGDSAKQTVSVIQDTIHPRNTQYGSGVAAECLRSVINDFEMLPRPFNPIAAPRRVIYEPSAGDTDNLTTSLQARFPAAYEMSFWATAVGASVTGEAPSTVLLNPGSGVPAGVKTPELGWGGKDSASTTVGTIATGAGVAAAAIYALPSTTADWTSSTLATYPMLSATPASYLKFAHPFAVGFSVICQWEGTDAAFDVLNCTGSAPASTDVMARASFYVSSDTTPAAPNGIVKSTNGLGSAKGFTVEGAQLNVTAGTWGAAQSAANLAGPWNNKTIMIVPIKGTPKIRGILWHLPGDVTDIMPWDMHLVGTWTQDVANGGIQSVCQGTNTAIGSGTFAEFTCTARMVFIHLEQTVASGQVDVWVNGDMHNAATEVWAGATGHQYLVVQPKTRLTGVANLGDLAEAQQMNIRIGWAGTQHGSASAPSGSNYRLKICGASIIK